MYNGEVYDERVKILKVFVNQNATNCKYRDLRLIFFTISITTRSLQKNIFELYFSSINRFNIILLYPAGLSASTGTATSWPTWRWRRPARTWTPKLRPSRSRPCSAPGRCTTSGWPSWAGRGTRGSTGFVWPRSLFSFSLSTRSTGSTITRDKQTSTFQDTHSRGGSVNWPS